jgi:hypothetical protein
MGDPYYHFFTILEVTTMNLNGIWSYELGGVYGWEPVGTLFFKDGHITGGGRNHFATGIYKTKSDGVVLHIEINQFGERRALFGQKSEQVRVDVKAKRDGNEMIGEATLPHTVSGSIHFGLCVRYKRRGDLPKEKISNS